MDSYPTPNDTQRFELEIKRSRFISTFAHVNGRAEAKAFIQTINQEFPDANHNCWAFVAGAPNDVHQYDQSDDGEPKGTAGKPMLNVLQHSDLGNVACVVTRYFGGIKLGAGGLVRAYSQSVSKFITELETRTCYHYIELAFSSPYTLLGSIEHFLNKEGIIITEKSFGTDVFLVLSVAEKELPRIKAELQELSHNSLEFLEDD